MLAALLGQAARADTISYTCKFTLEATKDKGLSKDSLALTFLVDTEAKKGYLIGNNGSSKVRVAIGRETITFTEATGSGIFQVTTVALTDGEAVHSRHSYLNGFIASQWYGRCQIRNDP